MLSWARNTPFLFGLKKKMLCNSAHMYQLMALLPITRLSHTPPPKQWNIHMPGVLYCNVQCNWECAGKSESQVYGKVFSQSLAEKELAKLFQVWFHWHTKCCMYFQTQAITCQEKRRTCIEHYYVSCKWYHLLSLQCYCKKLHFPWLSSFILL